MPPDGYDINSINLLSRYQTSLDRQFRNAMLNLRQYRQYFANPQDVEPSGVSVSLPSAPAPTPAMPPEPPATVAQRNEPETAAQNPQSAQPVAKSTPSHPPATAQTAVQAAIKGPVCPVIPIDKR